MNLLFLIYKTKETGLGHWYRMQVLMNAARARGHIVALATNELDFIPDWLVIDVPEDMYSSKVLDFLESYPYPTTRICTVDGISHKLGISADLNISQNLSGEYSAPEYLIMRKPVTQRCFALTAEWFVFGGASDKMKLYEKFRRDCSAQTANIVIGKFAPCPNIQDVNSKHHIWINLEDNIFSIMSRSEKACLAMGMTVWEALSLDLSSYVFSYSDRHLQSALAMEQAGYIKAFGETGLPEPKVFREFLQQPFTPTAPPIDFLGAERVIKLMEKL